MAGKSSWAGKRDDDYDETLPPEYFDVAWRDVPTVPALKDFTERVKLVFLAELKYLENDDTALPAYREAVTRMWNPWSPTLVQGSRVVAMHLELLFRDLVKYQKRGYFQLHSWIMPAAGASMLEALHMSVLSYWMSVPSPKKKREIAPDVEAYVRTWVTGTVPMIGRTTEPPKRSSGRTTSKKRAKR
jgi:hypothetical protein